MSVFERFCARCGSKCLLIDKTYTRFDTNTGAPYTTGWFYAKCPEIGEYKAGMDDYKWRDGKHSWEKWEWQHYKDRTFDWYVPPPPPPPPPPKPPKPMGPGCLIFLIILLGIAVCVACVLFISFVEGKHLLLV